MSTTPRHAEVPPELAPVFAEVEALVDRFFADRTVIPDEGRIDIHGERYVLVRGAALSVEFFTLVRNLFDEDRQVEADAFCRHFLFDLAHALGRSDARRFHSLMSLEDPIKRLAAGPAHFAHAGWASVRLLPGGNPEPGPDWALVYEHPRSFEADAWMDASHAPDFPVCVMNAGYSSGWTSESIGAHLVACELTCRALGHSECSFVMATPDRIAERVDARRQELGPEAAQAEIPSFFAKTESEENLRRSRAELQHQVDTGSEELRKTVLRLQEEQAARQRLEEQLSQTLKLDTIGKLAGGIAHDFGNLMVVISNRAELLSLEGSDPVLRADHLAAIQSASARAVDLTNHLRRLSRGKEPVATAVDVNLVVGDLVQLVGRGLGHRVRLRFSPRGDDLRVWIDRAQLEQVLLNLVVNARDAMQDGGSVQIRTGLTSAAGATQWVHVAVSDNGHGIPEDLHDRIFEPTFTTKSAGNGTGLGLATVASIVERAGGRIDLISAPGRGSTFTVVLPWGTSDPEPQPET